MSVTVFSWPLADDDEHAFLRFGKHGLIGRHARLALRDEREVDLDARAAAAGRLAGGAGEAGRAHVLHADDGLGMLEEFEARLEQQLLDEGITHLHGGPVGLRVLGQIARGEGGAGEAVAAGAVADVEDGIARAGGCAAPDLARAQGAEAEDVHQRVAVVARVEVDLAADRGHADAVAVVRDAGDDAGEQAAVGRGVRLAVADIAEAERIHEEDGPCAHGEDVAQDAADARGCALEGLDRARVVVRFHLEGDAPAVADVDHAGVFLARLDQHARAGSGELAQLEPRVLIGAVLAPHDREDAQLGEVRLTAEDGLDAREFIRREAVLGDEFGGDGGVGHGERP